MTPLAMTPEAQAQWILLLCFVVVPIAAIAFALLVKKVPAVGNALSKGVQGIWGLPGYIVISLLICVWFTVAAAGGWKSPRFDSGHGSPGRGGGYYGGGWSGGK